MPHQPDNINPISMQAGPPPARHASLPAQTAVVLAVMLLAIIAPAVYSVYRM